MINNCWINNNSINWECGILYNNELLTDIWFLVDGKYINLWDMCKTNIWEWSLILETNIFNLAEKQIFQSESSIIDWWLIHNSRFSKKEINIKLLILRNNIDDIILEIQNLKRLLNKRWLFLIRKILNREYRIWCILHNVEVNKLSQDWTEIELSILSLEPNFYLEENNTLEYIWNSWLFNWTIFIKDTDTNVVLDFIIKINSIVWNIDSIEIVINWFKLILNKTINEWDLIYIRSEDIFINWEDFFEYSWKNPELEPWQMTNIDINFIWWWNATDYNLEIIYKNISL